MVYTLKKSEEDMDAFKKRLLDVMNRRITEQETKMNTYSGLSQYNAEIKLEELKAIMNWILLNIEQSGEK